MDISSAVEVGINTILGGIGGGVFRLIPEVIKIFTTKGDRKHELAMRELDWKIAQSQADQKIREMDKELEISTSGKGLDAFVEAVKGQSTPAGNWFVDLLSMTVRPVVTYWWLTLFSLYKFASYSILIASGGSVAQALITLWTPDDNIMLAGILNFWFLGRVFDKQNKNLISWKNI